MKRKLCIVLMILAMTVFTTSVFAQSNNTSMVPRATTLTVNNPDFIAIMPDAKFRQAVIDSIDASGWTTNSIAVKDILNEYWGPINAKNKGIEDITGFKELMHAEEINLTGNNIKDFTPIWQGNTHYGYPNSSSLPAEREDVNLYLIIDKNPIERIPNSFGGHIDLKQPGTSSFTYPFDDTKDIYSFIRTKGSQRFDLTFELGHCKFSDGPNQGTYVPLLPNTLSLLKMSDDPEAPIKPTPLNIPHKLLSAAEAPGNEANRYAKVSEILLNQELKLGVGSDEVLGYWTNDEFGTNTEGHQSFKYYQDFKTRIYDRVKLVHNDKGSVSLLKTDKDSGLPLAGAEYDFYKEDTIYKSGLKTNVDGQIIVRDLEKGNYSFRETKAPVGYKLDATPVNVVVSDPNNAHGTIGGGVINTVGATVAATDGTTSTPLEADEIMIAGSDTADIDLNITGGPYSVIVDYSGLAMSRQPGKLDPEAITKIFATADEAKADINEMKNTGRIAGPVTITVQYAPNVDVAQANEKKPSTPPTPTPPSDQPNTGDSSQVMFWTLLALLSVGAIGMVSTKFLFKK